MNQTRIKWVENKTFLGIDSTNHSVVLSSPDDGTGMKPSELLLVALASCTAMDVVNILRKKKTPLASLEISVEAEQEAEPPWTFKHIHLKFLLSGNGLTEKSVSQAIHLSEEKYCSVAATIRGVTNISWEFEILPMQE